MIILVRPDDKFAAPLLQHCLLLLPLQRNAMLLRNAMLWSAASWGGALRCWRAQQSDELPEAPREERFVFRMTVRYLKKRLLPTALVSWTVELMTSRQCKFGIKS